MLHDGKVVLDPSYMAGVTAPRTYLLMGLCSLTWPNALFCSKVCEAIPITLCRSVVKSKTARAL
jgi:hypothetical protein